MKVLIADKFPEQYIDTLKSMGLEVDLQPKYGEADVAENIKGYDFLIVRSTKVNETAVNNADQLKVVIRAGSGYNTIAFEKAAEKGIAVANCPGKNAVAVAELAIGLMLSLDRRIPDNVNDFGKGVWNKAEYSKSDGLKGKTLGLIGVGNIGKEVAQRALSFGMKVYGKDIVKIEGIDVTQFEDIKEMLPKFDIVSVHLPQNAETKGIFNEEMFSLMKEGAMFINTSRAGVVDQKALIAAVKSKNLRVGLDVFDEEPEGKTGEVSSELIGLPNVYVTHHIGASTEQAQNAVAEEAIRIIQVFKDSGEVPNKVN